MDENEQRILDTEISNYKAKIVEKKSIITDEQEGLAKLNLYLDFLQAKRSKLEWIPVYRDETLIEHATCGGSP